jgi:hypothetical protein
LKIHFNVIVPSMPSLPSGLFSSGLPTYPASPSKFCVQTLPHQCVLHSTFVSFSFIESTSKCLIKLLVMEFSPTFNYLISLISKCSLSAKFLTFQNTDKSTSTLLYI